VRLLAARWPRLGLGLLFALWALATAWALDRWDAALNMPYMLSISEATAWVLNTVGIPTSLGSVAGRYAILSMDHAVFHVTRECTGIQALGLYVAAVLSYPASGRQRLIAVARGLPAFFVYSVGRLIVLAVVAQDAPGWTQFLHIYLLVLVNAGFLLWLWAIWVKSLDEEKG
jgi:exosortase/archaeosortase family protein